MGGPGTAIVVGFIVLISSTSAWEPIECPKPYHVEEQHGFEMCLYRPVSFLPVTWDQDRMKCFGAHYGDLATANNEQKFLILLRGSGPIWVGLHKVQRTDYFKWVDDNTPLDRGFQHSPLFGPDRSSRGRMRMECVMLDRSQRGLRLYPCFNHLSYVCQYEPNATKVSYFKL